MWRSQNAMRRRRLWLLACAASSGAQPGPSAQYGGGAPPPNPGPTGSNFELFVSGVYEPSFQGYRPGDFAVGPSHPTIVIPGLRPVGSLPRACARALAFDGTGEGCDYRMVDI